jgi:hypothetical protein
MAAQNHQQKVGNHQGGWAESNLPNSYASFGVVSPSTKRTRKLGSESVVSRKTRRCSANLPERISIMKTARIASAALFGTLSLGAMAPAFAQTATTTAVTAATTASTRQAEHAARQDASAADLATRLGITKEKVLAAWTAQAALPRPARTTTGVRPTVAERKAAATARFAAYASSLGVSVSTLTKALGEQQKANIDTRVTDGSLTAAQAAARKAVVDADVAAGDVHGIGGKGGRGGHGGGHGRH